MPTSCWGLTSSDRGGSGCPTAHKKSSCCAASKARCRKLPAESSRRTADRRGNIPGMSIGTLIGSVVNVRRKLRAMAAVIADPAATPHEKANAEVLKGRLERRLKEAGVPTGEWTDHAHRQGMAVRQGYKRSVSE